jgi:TonB-linked SusC/RagA family outer membrane protein
MKIIFTLARQQFAVRCLLYNTLRPVLAFVLSLMVMPIMAQNNINVKGRITDENNQPISRVTVALKGTTIGTTTNENGEFSIAAPSNGTLVITSVGYPAREVSIDGQETHNISLTALASGLEQVVVVGYGSQRKRDVTGSVASVNLETRRDLPNTNIGQFLQGSVPGLNVGMSTFSGGTPPISIRGRVTLSGNQNVLIILDGIQYTGSLSSINPDDIATIDVLKDASSTAVYGAQAANGVILITTRKGRSGLKPRIQLSSSYTLQKPTIGDLRPFDRAGFIEFMRENFYDKAYLAPDYTTPNPNYKLQDWIDPVLGTPAAGLQPHDYDWFDEATNDGSIYETSLSISGGSDRFTYFLSGALVDQKGYIINDKFKRKTVRVNLETKPLTWWKVGIMSSGSFVNQDGAEPSFGSIQRMPPLLKPYDSLGALIPFPTRTLEPSPFTTYYVDDKERNNYYFANIYTDINFPFLKGLNYRMNFGNNYRESNRFFASIYAAGQTGQAYKNNQNYYDYTFDNILTYTKAFGKHDITATLLYGASEREFNSTSARAEGFTRLNLGYNNLSLGTNRFTESSANSEALNYQMARVNYKFNERYLVTATVRRDGFSGFAKNNKYGVFPVLALGWVISEENWLQKNKIINLLKLRAGYGVNGNQTSQYTSIARVETNTSYIFGDGGSTAFGQQVSSLGNDDLEWERTTGLNVGVDFGLINTRLTGSLDFYRNQTTDLLYSINIPAVTGFSNIRTNVGKLNNTGFEALINYGIIRNKDFNWDANFNFSTNTNKIETIRGIDANGDGVEDDLVSSGLFINKSIGAIYDYQLDGIYQLTDTRLPGFPVGSLRIVDQDKNGDITQAGDRILLGRREPAYRFSLGNTFAYKGLSLYVFINSVQGGEDGFLGLNNPSFFREDNTIRINSLRGIDYWSPTNPGGKYPRNISGTRAKFEPNYWQDRSFVRLQDVTLSYNFSKFLKKLPVETLSIFLSGKNLHTWTDWEGWDPETEANDANNVLQAQGLLIGGRPVLRTYTLGLNLVF